MKQKDEYTKWVEQRLARLESVAREMYVNRERFAAKHEKFNEESDRVWTELGQASGVLPEVLP